MTESAPIAKRHIRRLQIMLKDLELYEAAKLYGYGERMAGTVRSSKWMDAEALRAVLASLAAAPTVEQAINTLVTALAASKGWMRDYADSVVRDAVDRKPEAMTAHPDFWCNYQSVLEAIRHLDPMDERDSSGAICKLVMWGDEQSAASHADRAAPAAPNEGPSQTKPHAMTTAERAAWVRGHSAGWDAARGLDADMPRHLADGNEIEPQ